MAGITDDERFWLTQNLITLFSHRAANQYPEYEGLQVTSILLVTYCVLFFSYIGMGMLGQKSGGGVSS